MIFGEMTKADFKKCDDGSACDMCAAYGAMAHGNADEEHSRYITKEFYSEAFGSLLNPPIRVHLCRWCYKEQPQSIFK